MSRLWRWIPAVLWACLISLFSTDTFSKEHTSWVLIPFLQWLFPHANSPTLELSHYVLRKCAHVLEYFVFGLLVFRAIRGPRRGWTPRWAAATLIVCGIFAAGDEFHQFFVPSRQASPWDALLDTSAAAAAVFLIWLLAREAANKKARSQMRAGLEQP
jgi:VanZ family protein